MLVTSRLGGIRVAVFAGGKFSENLHSGWRETHFYRLMQLVVFTFYG